MDLLVQDGAIGQLASSLVLGMAIGTYIILWDYLIGKIW